jgi:hypothetical protein
MVVAAGPFEARFTHAVLNPHALIHDRAIAIKKLENAPQGLVLL